MCAVPCTVISNVQCPVSDVRNFWLCHFFGAHRTLDKDPEFGPVPVATVPVKEFNKSPPPDISRTVILSFQLRISMIKADSMVRNIREIIIPWAEEALS